MDVVGIKARPKYTAAQELRTGHEKRTACVSHLASVRPEPPQIVGDAVSERWQASCSTS
jgi:hypothetical protein